MKTQHAADLMPSHGIARAGLWISFSFAAVLAISAGPAWLTLPIVVAYAAAVL